jgi:hypothetical protein
MEIIVPRAILNSMDILFSDQEINKILLVMFANLLYTNLFMKIEFFFCMSESKPPKYNGTRFIHVHNLKIIDEGYVMDRKIHRLQLGWWIVDKNTQMLKTF